MATADRSSRRHSSRRRHRHHDELYDEDRPRRRKSHAFRNFALVMFCLLLVAGYFAPTIIAKSPLCDWLVQTAVAPNGSIHVGSASLGWFSPIDVANVELRDAAGESVASVKSLKSEKPLYALLLDSNNLGHLDVAQPTIHLVAYEKDTNLERVLANFLAAESDAQVTAKVKVSEGTLLVEDAIAKRTFKINQLAAECTVGDAAEGIVLAASGALEAGKEPGNFKVDLRTKPSAEAGQLAAGTIKCNGSSLPLEALDPLLRRTIQGAQLGGQLSADLEGSWGSLAPGGGASLAGKVDIANLNFQAALLGDDKIQIAAVEIPCRIRQQGDKIEIDELAARCELGEIALTGSAKASDFSADNVAAALARENYDVKGRIDLAKLAHMLPDTLMIREGTEITSGDISIAGTARQQPSGMSWTGLVETKRLAATANGHPVSWDKPLVMQFALHEKPNGIIVDRAVCSSSFLQVNAAGALDNMSASAEFDLARLVTELKQFSDLNDVQLAGQGRAHLNVKRAGDNSFTADAEFQARGFQWITTQSRPWTEDNLYARLTLNGQLAGQSLKRVAEASLTLDAGADHFEGNLKSPVDDPLNAAWPLTCAWRGQLDAWPARLESCLGMSGWNLAGSGTLDADVKLSTQSVAVENAALEITPLQAQGHGFFITEPKVSAKLSGTCDVAKRRLELTSASFKAGSAVATVDRVVLASTAQGWTLDGKSHVEGDLNQFARWRQDPRAPTAWQASGRLVGDTEFKHTAGTTTGRLEGAVDQLVIVDTARPVARGAQPATWQEPRVTLAARGNFQHVDGQLNLEALQVASNALRIDATGGISTKETGGNVDLKGTMGYDWAQLAPLWRPYLGNGFQVAGRETREIAVRGPLTGPPWNPDSWKQVTGQAAVGWTAMSLHGMRVGPGDIRAELSDGQVRTRPIDLEVSEGRLTMSPVARLSPAPAEVVLSNGPLLTNVRLSPELCAQGMRFVTPLLADATVAEGTFSVTIDNGRLPLLDPAAGDVSGSMVMKGQIKPGIIAQEFVGIIKELLTILQRGTLDTGIDGSLVSVDNSKIEFRMINRRVYHRGLTIVVGTTPVTTEGSVGFDESLSLVAEVPINARLLGADLSLGALEGKKLKIPISGTLKRPTLDRRALQEIPRQLIENTARDLLFDGLNKGLDRLIKPQ
ncbi:MAG: hypothetical protein AB7O59_18335 [Pirellulales bacterium]